MNSWFADDDSFLVPGNRLVQHKQNDELHSCFSFLKLHKVNYSRDKFRAAFPPRRLGRKSSPSLWLKSQAPSQADESATDLPVDSLLAVRPGVT